MSVRPVYLDNSDGSLRSAGGALLGASQHVPADAQNITSGTNTATITKPSAVFTFKSFTTAADTVGATNTITAAGLCTAASRFRFTILSYVGTYGTNGNPTLVQFAGAAGSFTFKVYNQHATNALSGDFVARVDIIN